jgi:threonine dehydrogenase-like Zn-dependent dehydrogenase
MCVCVSSSTELHTTDGSPGRTWNEWRSRVFPANTGPAGFDLRLALARVSGAETVNFDEQDDTILEKLKEMTGGKGPDKCIDAVGAASHATASFDAILDKAKAAGMLGTDRPHALRAAIMACRPGGIVSVSGVYGGFLDKGPSAPP